MDPTFSYQVREGEFIFLEKNRSGKYVRERFEITETDVSELQELLRQVKEDFYSLKFLQRPPCRQCEACQTLGFTPSAVEQYQSYYQPESETLPESKEA
jgi:arginyl-tRNA--protein-N-Asp/Glu arginylyltransferase